MEEKKEKRVLTIELDDEDLDEATGGCSRPPKAYFSNGSPST